MSFKSKLTVALALVSTFLWVAACKKSATPENIAAAKPQVEENLPQPSEVTGVPQFNWRYTREDANSFLTKQGLTTERFQKRYLAYNGKFDGYGGRVLMGFEWEKGRPGPLQSITLFLWPEKPGDANKQRPELFDFWNNKLTKRYGATFKTEATERTKSHIWQVRPDFAVELRGITAPDGKAQIAIYWAREGAPKEPESTPKSEEKE